MDDFQPLAGNDDLARMARAFIGLSHCFDVSLIARRRWTSLLIFDITR